MSSDDSGQCKICSGWNCNILSYVQNGTQIKCNFLKELNTENIFLKSEIVMLKQSIADLQIKALTKGDIKNIFINLEKNLNVSPEYGQKLLYLLNILQHKNLSIENRYFIFQQALTNKYEFLINGQFTNIINENVKDFIDFLKYNMDDYEENTLIEFIKIKSHQIFYTLPLFFQLERPRLSEFLEDIMYETIIERNTDPKYNSSASFTSGTWSIDTLVSAYKDANLGKAIYAIKKIAPTYANSAIENFVKKYPQAEKYAMLI